MITHLVLLTLKPELSDPDRRAFATAFERAARDISTVRHVRIGERIKIGAGYEAQMPNTAQYLAALDFDDVEGLKTYLEHEKHVELGALFWRSLSDAVVLDFQVGGLELLKELLTEEGGGSFTL